MQDEKQAGSELSARLGAMPGKEANVRDQR